MTEKKNEKYEEVVGPTPKKQLREKYRINLETPEPRKCYKQFGKNKRKNTVGRRRKSEE